MTAEELHQIAQVALDKKVEVIFAEELDKILNAAEQGKFSIILDNNNFTDLFIHYLSRRYFIVQYYNNERNKWHECNVTSTVPWHYCSKIYISW